MHIEEAHDELFFCDICESYHNTAEELKDHKMAHELENQVEIEVEEGEGGGGAPDFLSFLRRR